MATSDAPISIDSVTLTVHDLDTVADFYARVIGLAVHTRDREGATLGADRPLLHLRQDPAAPRRSPRDAGLFHTAFLLPSRPVLGGWLRHVETSGARLDGAADHGVSEAFYLADPEGNGVEVYWDKPREEWPLAGDRIEMGNDPVDAAGILAAARPWTGAPDGTVIGHVHLQVGEVAAAEAFWTGEAGLALTHRYPAASFFASGGYHHHIAANTWRSRGAPPLAFPRTGLTDVALRAAPGTTLRGRCAIRDPWNVPIRIVDVVSAAAAA
jgi:catechol 2,3-dioxygenase